MRENWYLLSYAQLETLLGIDAKTLENWLYHEDFLYVKLGYFKPDVECPAYSPLTPEQLLKTREISEIVRAQNLAAEEQPFDFETRFEKLCDPPAFECAGETRIHDRIVHAYLGGSGDLLELDVEACFPDSYLSAVAKRGVTGLFIHAVLDQLSRFPFQPERSEGYGERRKVLAVLVERLKKHGLSLYLYFNEPSRTPRGNGDGLGRAVHEPSRGESVLKERYPRTLFRPAGTRRGHHDYDERESDQLLFPQFRTPDFLPAL